MSQPFQNSNESSYDIADPNPCALVESLRSVGYSLPTAIADIIDNSITAKANNIWIRFHWSGPDSSISILDDGEGMTEPCLVDAMRPGTKNPTDERDPDDLGRFGLGLKTASFSQCRMLTVWTKAQNKSIVGRRWDLDYVAKHNEWRLQKDFDVEDSDVLSRLKIMALGTLVIWRKLDRIVDDSVASSDEAHQRFLRAIDDVMEYLSMIFHRYISGKTTISRNPINIYFNGCDAQHMLSAWNPFEISHANPSQSSPLEEIYHGGHQVRLQGFVLPHKDKLTDREYQLGAGHRGWIAQQGFYIYRNDRILLAGDWLRLGRGRPWAKEEQYKLARIFIDIPNALDLDWSLDVKKSTARPPAILRDRLTGLATKIRDDAKKAFVHRGQYGTRQQTPALIIEKPWESKERNGNIIYKINKKHPLIEGVLKRLGPLVIELESMLRLIEETVPVQRIWLDTAESGRDHATPYQGIEENLVLSDMKKTYKFLCQVMNTENAQAYLLATEPFNRFPHLVNQLIIEE